MTRGAPAERTSQEQFVLNRLGITASFAFSLLVPGILAAEGNGGDKPAGVSHLTAMPYADDAIYAAWSESESGGEPSRYLVQARNVEGGGIQRKWGDADNRGHIFKCLDSGETYRIRVSAANSEGRGPATWERVELPDYGASSDDFRS